MPIEFQCFTFVLTLIVLADIVHRLCINGKKEMKEMMKKDLEEKLPSVHSFDSSKFPRNAKWFKEFRQQVRNQKKVNTQYRNGLLRVFTHHEEIVLSVDYWILRRLRSIRAEEIYSFLGEELGLGVKGINISRSKTTRTPQFFRLRKRRWSEKTHHRQENEDND